MVGASWARLLSKLLTYLMSTAALEGQMSQCTNLGHLATLEAHMLSLAQALLQVALL
jgi:hypothetical protein